MPHVKVVELVEIEQNKDGWPLLILPKDPKKWARDLQETYRQNGYIGMFAQNIPDGGKTIEVYFGGQRVSDASAEPPTEYFGLVLEREEFRKMVKSLQLVLEASDNE